MNFLRPSIARLVLAALLFMSIGCDGLVVSPGPAPLRPLVYTEVPEITPEAASVRERRIIRELVDGVRAVEAADAAAPRKALLTAEDLGAEVVSALFERDETRWDQVFVQPEHYAGLVHVKPEAARDFVDEIQGASKKAWDIFEPVPASEGVDGGFRSLFKLSSVELGAPRSVDGKVVDDEAMAVQYWNNKLIIDYRGRASFALTVPKILRIGTAPGVREFAIGSKIGPDPLLDVFIGAGLHLKPELLRSGDYPIPLQVGTFWRYRRQRPGVSEDPFDAVDETAASTVIVEVISVDRYDTMRLVKIRRSYDDADLTKSERWWLVTPRRVDLCDRGCRGHIEDLAWILEYLRSNTPIFSFPIRNEGWGPFRVVPVDAVDVPAGVFTSVVGIEGVGPIGLFDRRLKAQQLRIFAHGHGVVRREIGSGPDALIEELVEYRIMP